MTWPAALNGLLLIAPGRVGELAEVWSRVAGSVRAALATSETAPRYRRSGGSAIIPVKGILINGGSLLGDWGATSYDALACELRAAAADPQITRIVLDIDSPGGMVAGLEKCEEAIAEARTRKPLAASVDSCAASAAYWIASQSDEIVIAARAEVGSIGIVAVHSDIGRMLDDAGVTISLIHAGSHKVDGHPYGPLPSPVRADFQKEVDELRIEFARAVAAGRPGRLSTAAALATEARMYRGEKAVAAGLADRVGSLDSILAGPARRGEPALPARPARQHEETASSLEAEIMRGRAETERGHSAFLAAVGSPPGAK
jgi:capsid assembly protease